MEEGHAGAGSACGWRSLRLRRSETARHEGREHRQRLAEHRHVLARLLFDGSEHRPRRAGKRSHAEGLRALIAERALLGRQLSQRELEIARHHHLHAVAVETDELAQKGDRQKALAVLAFLLKDDLREHGTGDLLAAPGIEHDEIFAALDHHCEVFERDVGARSRIVEAPVRVFFDGDGRFVARHGWTCFRGGPATNRFALPFTRRLRAFLCRVAAGSLSRPCGHPILLQCNPPCGQCYDLGARPAGRSAEFSCPALPEAPKYRRSFLPRGYDRPGRSGLACRSTRLTPLSGEW